MKWICSKQDSDDQLWQQPFAIYFLQLQNAVLTLEDNTDFKQMAANLFGEYYDLRGE